MSEAQITAYKGFDKDLSCRNLKYEVGKTYEHRGSVSLCDSGFHACLNPFDVWGYYSLTQSRFAVVTLESTTDAQEDDSDTKIAAAKITVEAELSLPEFIKRGIDWLIATKGCSRNNSNNYSARLGSTGYGAQIGSSGNYAQIGSSGDHTRIGSSGYSAQISSGGDFAQIGSSGHYARIGSSGDNTRIGSCGYSAQISSGGDFAQIGSSGHYARIGSSGDNTRIGSCGRYARISSSGYGARIEVEGERSVIASAGPATHIKAAAGTWVSVAEYDSEMQCVGFATGCIGEGGLQPDTWYCAKGGELVEVMQ